MSITCWKGILLTAIIIPNLFMLALIGYDINLLVRKEFEVVMEHLQYIYMCICTTLLIITMSEFAIYRKVKELIGMMFIVLSFVLNMYTYLVGYSANSIVAISCIKIIGYVSLASGFIIYFLTLTRNIITRLIIICIAPAVLPPALNLVITFFTHINQCQFSWWIIMQDVSSYVMIGIYLVAGLESEKDTNYSFTILWISHAGYFIGENYLTNNFCVSNSDSFEIISLPIMYQYYIVFIGFMIYLHKDLFITKNQPNHQYIKLNDMNVVTPV